MFLHGQFGVGVQMAVQLVHPDSLVVGEFEIPQGIANHVSSFFDWVFLLSNVVLVGSASHNGRAVERLRDGEQILIGGRLRIFQDPEDIAESEAAQISRGPASFG
jgi:hypothetical protein